MAPFTLTGAFVLSEPELKKKQWVYKRLVNGDNDFVGLIAYGVYKRRKTELAERHRADGCSEAEIEEKIAVFHDQVVTGNEDIERYRRDASAMLGGLINQTQEELRADYGRQCAAMEKKHAAAEAKAKKQWIDDLSKGAKWAKQTIPLRDRVASWLMDGLQTTIAGIVVTILGFGIMSAFTSDNLKAEMLAKTVQLLTGASPKSAEAQDTKK